MMIYPVCGIGEVFQDIQRKEAFGFDIFDMYCSKQFSVKYLEPKWDMCIIHEKLRDMNIYK